MPRICHRRALRALLGGIVLPLFWASGAQAGMRSSVLSLELGHDDNLGNSSKAAEAISSPSYLAALDTQWLYALQPTYGAALGLDLRYRHLPELEALNQTEATAWARAWLANSADMHNVWLDLEIFASLQEVDSQQRDAQRFGAQIQLRGRWGSLFSAGLGLGWRRQDAREAVFDSELLDLFLRAESRWSAANSSRIQWHWLQGDQASAIVPPDPAAVAAAERIRPDDALLGYNSYRLDSRSWVLRMGHNLALSERWALDLVAQSIRSRADQGLRYSRAQVGLALLYSF